MTNVFLSVLGVSVSVGLLIAALLLLTPFLNRRYAAKWKYGVWVVLALRLLIPFDGIREQPAANAQPLMKTQNVSESEKDHEDVLTHRTAPGRVIIEVPEQMITPIVAKTEKSSVSITLLDAAAFAWAFGSLLFIAVHLFSYFHYKRQILKNGTVIEDEAVLCLLPELKRELHITGTVTVMEYAEVPSPMIIGFMRQILVLPKEQYKAEELYFIMKHELVHLKRRDLYFKLLFMMANALHWFNPFVWIMQKEAVIDMELSCDERVTQGVDYTARKAYTETLLSTLHKQCAARKKYAKRTSLSTQFYGGKRIMKKRFKNILIKTGKKNGIAILVCAVILTASLGTLAGCSIAKGTSEDSSDRLGTEDIQTEYIQNENVQDENIQANESLPEADGNSPKEEQPLDDYSIFIGDLSLSIYESKEDMLAKLEEAGLECKEFKPDNPEEDKFDSCYNIDAGIQIYFLDEECVRLRVIGAGLEDLDEIPQTARGIHPGNTYSQMVEQYGDSYESRKYVGKEIYGLFRYFADDYGYILEFGIPGENRDSIYNIDIYDSSQFPIYDYGEELEAMGKEGKEEQDSEWPMHIDVTPPSLGEDMSLGADFVILDYADESIVIFHGYFGLFVYDKGKQSLIGAVDLAAIGCDSTQGDDYCEIWVEEDGSRVYLSPLTSNMMYVYDVAGQSLVMEPYDIGGIEMFDSFIDPQDPEYIGIIRSGRDFEGFMSFQGAAVKDSRGRAGYGYLLAFDGVGSVIYEEVTVMGEGTYEYASYPVFEGMIP